MRGHHPRVMILYHTTEGTPEGEDVTLIYWATGWGEAERPKLPVSSYIVSSCRRRARLKGAFSAGPPRGIWAAEVLTMMALTMSLWLSLSARTAFALDTLAWAITSSMSRSSSPASSTWWREQGGGLAA